MCRLCRPGQSLDDHPDPPVHRSLQVQVVLLQRQRPAHAGIGEGDVVHAGQRRHRARHKCATSLSRVCAPSPERRITDGLTSEGLRAGVLLAGGEFPDDVLIEAQMFLGCVHHKVAMEVLADANVEGS